METAIRELLVERRLIEPGEIRRQIEVLDSRTPALGAKVVARAWVDPAFRARLLANGRAACEELGIGFYDDTQLIVLENTEPFTTSSSARSVRATRGRCSACRPTGTS